MDIRKVLTWVTGLFLLVGGVEAGTLVATNSVWKYRKGTNEASVPVTAWRGVTYADAGWSQGGAPFYYGESLSGGTLIPDMLNTYTSFFLRRTFVAGAGERTNAVFLSTRCDDGFIAWINGVEVARYNVPEGDLAFNAVGSSAVPEPVVTEEQLLPDPAGYLVAGTNVLAVQVFNVSLGSSDLQFDAGLFSIVREGTPPVITSIDPPPGEVFELNRITVTFSEDVRGVDAQDLWLNGKPAVSMTGSGRIYTFTFDAARPGRQDVSWLVRHEIVDFAQPPNSFDDSAPQHLWSYTVPDRIPPRLAGVTPPASARVRGLDWVEVVFDEAVVGVDAADLRMNGVAALQVNPSSETTYRFVFPRPAAGPVTMEWVADHGIRDEVDENNRFRGGVWSYQFDPLGPPPRVVINEVMAANVGAAGLKDEEGDAEDWIELRNLGNEAVDLTGWSITDDAAIPGQWVLPRVTIPGNGILVLFASGKDRWPTNSAGRMHTNFKLSVAGEYLGLYSADAPRRAVSEISPGFPEQRNDVAYALREDGTWGYTRSATPGQLNRGPYLESVASPVKFSVDRGFFNTPFQLFLSSENPGGRIRYTLDGSEPGEGVGRDYTQPIQVSTTAVVRAVCLVDGALPSKVQTHTYLVGLPAARRSLPVISIVTASNSLRGPTGIMEINPRNTTKRGIAWERPSSAEYIRPEDNGGFQLDCGLRVQGGDYIRARYTPVGTAIPESKFSLRLYFRGDYGQTKLVYPLFGGSRVREFDRITLRAGMNDPTNPFMVDELMRRLSVDTGQVCAQGGFVNLFINGVYKGYYNPTEGYEEDFFQAWHGGPAAWDIMAQFGEVAGGDNVAFQELLNHTSRFDQSQRTNYLRTLRMLDVTNFVDYLLVNIYGGTGDWPHNNWRAARPKVPGGLYRFYIWDAEWSLGNQGRSVNLNTITGELAGTTEIPTIYKGLVRSPEFRLLFADRVQKHFFNGGALMDENITNRFNAMRTELAGVIPNMQTTIPRNWVPARRRNVFTHLTTARLMASSNAPVFSRMGGTVPAGFGLSISAPEGAVYYTTDGVDPRVAFDSVPAPTAVRAVANRALTLTNDTLVKARSLSGTNWSALTEAVFQVGSLGSSLVFSEVMYNPPGGDAYEFIEILNTGGVSVNLAGMSLGGVSFTFPDGSTLAPGAVLVLGSDLNPSAFATRYPGVTVLGRFSGTLGNGGEVLTLKDGAGQVIARVSYDDQDGWPVSADGGGASLELIDPTGDPDAAGSWRGSVTAGGSPGVINAPPTTPGVRLNEVLAENLSAVKNGTSSPDYVELHNGGSSAVNLAGWSLTDDSVPRKFVFPSGTSIAPGGYLVVWCDLETSGAGLHSGFSLGKGGETLSLFDPQTNRVDVISFGLQVADRSLGRNPALAWVLGVPTPGAANLETATAGASSLSINEWLANPPLGLEDWIELYNRDASRPAALGGVYLGTSNGVFQVRAHSFIAPSGFVQLLADEGTGSNHLPFKLQAAGDAIVLHDSNGTLVEKVSFGARLEGVTSGRLPDGGTTIVDFALTQSPGASNHLPGGVSTLFHELLAGGLETNGGSGDWLELRNTNTVALDLSRYVLGLDVGDGSPREFVFPAGVSVPAGGYRVIGLEGGSPASTTAQATLNAGFSIPASGGALSLADGSGRLLDSLVFGAQLNGASIGLVGGQWRLLRTPTPGAGNSAPADLGNGTSVRINEWMATDSSGSDWIELYNPGALPVTMGGFFLTDDPSIAGQTLHQLRPLTFIGAGGFLRLDATGNGTIVGELGFSLDALGESLRLYTPEQSLVDGVDFGPQQDGVSAGRLPDGSASIVFFDGSSSPAANNFVRPVTPVITEILTHTDPPLADAIEFFNPTAAAVDISGWYLSNSADNWNKYRIPDGTVLGPYGRVVVYETAFNANPSSSDAFTFNSAHGDEAWLTAVNPAGQRTGFRTMAAFGAAENGVSFGLHQTSQGDEWTAMASRTFGVDQPQTVPQFAQGAGAPNSLPRNGPVVISELMYNPVTLVGTNRVERVEEEFVEVRNVLSERVALYDPANPGNRWKLDGGVQFTFPEGFVINGRQAVLVVGFDPVAKPAELASFREKYSVPSTVLVLGPMTGGLSNSGEAVELLKPDPPQGPDRPDAGFVPYIRVDRVVYRDRSPWPTAADGSGLSLQRLALEEYGNEPLNWVAAAPTAGRDNPTVSADTDGDGLPDAWELAFGFDLNTPTDGAADMDGDLVSNRDEYLAGTHPRDAASRLALTTVLKGVTLTLVTPGSPGRSYTLESRPSLDSGAWTVVAQSRAGGESGLVVWDVPVSSAGRGGFYRVRANLN